MKCGTRSSRSLCRAKLSGIWCHHLVSCDESKESKRVVFLSVEVPVQFCENVGVFSQYTGLDKESLLEGGNGAYIGRLAVLREDDLCQCYSGKSGLCMRAFYGQMLTCFV